MIIIITMIIQKDTVGHAGNNAGPENSRSGCHENKTKRMMRICIYIYTYIII